MHSAARFIVTLALSWAVLGTSISNPLRGADDEETFTDPADAGPDFEVQGEYTGRLTVGDQDVYGAQIIALGDGKFRLVGFKGGLPGDGWMRGDDHVTVEGASTNGTTRFMADTWSSSIAEGKMTVRSEDGDILGTLIKQERKSDTLGAQPPVGAVVLFDGSNADQFVDGHLTDDHLLLADVASKLKFQDHILHVEFRTPFKPKARGQARGNSGVYIQGRSELQVLDSFGLEGENNDCGGIYTLARPIVNMCYPPLSWQTYDIDFTAARYEGDNKTKNARVTIRHNGVVVHDNFELPRSCPGYLPEGPDPAPLYLQGHGNPVVYRNIWAVMK
jgi:hypothetical protein